MDSSKSFTSRRRAGRSCWLSDMRRLVLAAFSIVSVVVVATAHAASRPETCSTCHRGIEDAHPKKALACTICHRGDPAATTYDKAHAGMWANPSDLRVVDRTCGAGGCHQAIAAKVKSSIMAHRSGTQSGTLFPNGLQLAREAVTFSMTPIPEEPGVKLAKGQALPPGAVPHLDPLPTFKESG